MIRDYIEERLGDPRLCPKSIASAHHISIRLLYKLFEGQDLSVAGWIKHRRLERCRDDLVDPDLRGWPVCAIGARWGMREPAAFSRAFRRAYGQPPGEFRAGARPGAVYQGR